MFHFLMAASTIAVTAFGLFSSATAADKTVRLASLEWPPYNGKDLADQGINTLIVKKAFAAAGYTLKVDFLPWKRAIALGLNGVEGHDGYFPEYYSEAAARKDCLFSEEMGISPIGLAERRNKPHPWTEINDLKDKRIGVVNGYVNTAEFDERVAKGEIKVQGVGHDNLNLKKLAGGRLDLAVIDTMVFAYLVSSQPKLKAALQINKKLLGKNGLFICFRQSNPERSRELAEAFKTGIATLDFHAIQNAYMEQ